MSERERWIVYPLLFLALGAALRDKLIDLTSTKHIVCQELIVMGDERPGREPTPLVRVGEGQRNGPAAVPYGAIDVDGVIRAKTVIADNFVPTRGPHGSGLLRVAPGTTLGDLLRAVQRAASEAQRSQGQSTAPDAAAGDAANPSFDAQQDSANADGGPAVNAPVDAAPTSLAE